MNKRCICCCVCELRALDLPRSRDHTSDNDDTLRSRLAYTGGSAIPACDAVYSPEQVRCAGPHWRCRTPLVLALLSLSISSGYKYCILSANYTHIERYCFGFVARLAKGGSTFITEAIDQFCRGWIILLVFRLGISLLFLFTYLWFAAYSQVMRYRSLALYV